MVYVVARELSPEISQFLRFSSLTGFIVVTTLIINLNFKAFRFVFKEKTGHYWWLFLLLALVPLGLIMFIFTLLFG